MDVILLEKIDNLGGLGDKVNVKAGYGGNFLIPTRKAVSATKKNLAEFQAPLGQKVMQYNHKGELVEA